MVGSDALGGKTAGARNTFNKTCVLGEAVSSYQVSGASLTFHGQKGVGRFRGRPLMIINDLGGGPEEIKKKTFLAALLWKNN